MNYMRTLRAMSDLVKIIVPDSVIEILAGEYFSELNAELRDQGLTRFGASVLDQAMFTVWTLRKIHDLIPKISTSEPVAKANKAKDGQLAMEFSVASAWTQFHLDCLSAAIRFDRPLYPEVLVEITEGLRTAVNAYGLIRQGVNLRVSPNEPTIEARQWDEEDEELLNSSMHDMDHETDPEAF